MFAIGDIARGQGEPVTDRLFVRRMHIVRLADIERDRHAGVGEAERPALRVADDAPLLLFGRGEAGNLDDTGKGSCPRAICFASRRSSPERPLEYMGASAFLLLVSP